MPLMSTTMRGLRLRNLVGDGCAEHCHVPVLLLLQSCLQMVVDLHLVAQCHWRKHQSPNAEILDQRRAEFLMTSLAEFLAYPSTSLLGGGALILLISVMLLSHVLLLVGGAVSPPTPFVWCCSLYLLLWRGAAFLLCVWCCRSLSSCVVQLSSTLLWGGSLWVAPRDHVMELSDTSFLFYRKAKISSSSVWVCGCVWDNEGVVVLS